MIRASLLLLAGGFAAQHNRVPIDPDLCMSLFVISVVLLCLRRSRWLAIFLLGFVLFMRAGTEIADARLDPQYAGDSILTQVRISDFPRRSGRTVSMRVEPVDDVRLPSHSRVTWLDSPQIPKIGERWQLELRLRRPRGNSNPGVFNLENWMFRENLQASGYVVAGKRNRLLGLVETGSAELSPLPGARRDFVDHAKSYGGDSAPVLAAIGVGARHLISREQWRRYAKTGTSHLMAISGLHIGLAAASSLALVALLSGGLRVRGNHLDRGVIGGALIAAAYAALSGFAVPSQRATIMLALVAMAFLWRRRSHPGRIVALAAMIVFLIDPISSMTPGFSLSFAAVIVLLWFARSYRRAVGSVRIYRAVASLRQLVAMQGVLLLGLMPLTVILFHRIALLAPVVNLIAVPVFSLLTVPLTLAAMVLHIADAPGSAALLRLSAVSIGVIEKIISFFAELSLADITIATAGINTWVVLLPALWVILPRGWPGRWLAIMAVFALLIHRPASPNTSCFDLHVLDIGQGLSVFVQSNQRTLVFDTGASYRGGGSAAEQLVIPFLRHRGIAAIDWLVVSHADNDHAGGVAALTGQFPIGQTYVGEPLRSGGLSALPCRAGQAWEADGVEYRFLYPKPDQRRVGNDSSCVLSVSAGQYRVLLTGDIEAVAERDLLAGLGSAAVVVIPHHGSLTSSSPAFVNRLRPELAITSAGYGNRWGFPKERVIQRWKGVGAAVLDTATSGAISLRVCAANGITRLREERQVQQRFWHDSP